MGELEVLELEGGRGLALAGELTAESAPQLANAFAGAQGGVTKLDLSKLTFIDTTGLHTIAALARSQNGNGRVTLEGAAPHIVRMFEITHLAEHPGLDIGVSVDGR